MGPESPAADAFTLSDRKTKPVCAALTDTAALPAFLWALEKDQVCPSCALQADTAMPSEEQPVQESSAGPQSCSHSSQQRGEPWRGARRAGRGDTDLCSSGPIESFMNCSESSGEERAEKKEAML